MKATRLLIILAIALMAICALSILSDDADARTCTWDGGDADDQLASSPDNWDLDTAPVEGDDILINSGSEAVSWDVSIPLGTFKINTGYSGVITQVSSMNISGFFMISTTATFTGVLTEHIDCYGNFNRTGGIITRNTINLVMWENSVINNAYRYSPEQNVITRLYVRNNLTVAATLVIGWNSPYVLHIDDGCVLTLNADMQVQNTGYIYNNGTIIGNGKLIFAARYNSYSIYDIGDVQANIGFYIGGWAGGSFTQKLRFDLSTPQNITISGSFYCTLDPNGYDIDAMSITIGAKGKLVNSGSSSRLNLGVFTCTDAASTFTPTNIVIVMSGTGVLSMKAGDAINTLEITDIFFSLSQEITVTSELRFSGLLPLHPYGLYFDDSRNASLTSDAGGIASAAPGVFAWDNATLKITPVISIDGWERTDGGLRNVVWEGYDYNADHDADAAVTWSLVTTGAWLTTNSDGEISGEAGDDAIYYYTLTATAANGETASVSGFIIVENSVNEGLSVAFSWLSPLIGLMAIGFLAVALSAFSGTWTKKK